MKSPVAWLVFWSSWFLAGCVSAERSAGDFLATPGLEAIAGTYRNSGTTTTGGTASARLSRLIWPEDKSLAHDSVALIEVQVLAERRLRVRASDATGQLLKVGEYEQGRDFQFTGRSLRLAPRSQMVGLKSGEPMVGVADGWVEFGLDQQGQGKARRTESATGLVYGFIPLSLGAAHDLRFARVR